MLPRVCGAVGTLCVGLFAIDGGLFYGGGAAYLGVQAIGVVAVAARVTIAMQAGNTRDNAHLTHERKIAHV
jgi:ammonia channel protein AmtB